MWFLSMHKFFHRAGTFPWKTVHAMKFISCLVKMLCGATQINYHRWKDNLYLMIAFMLIIMFSPLCWWQEYPRKKADICIFSISPCCHLDNWLTQLVLNLLLSTRASGLYFGYIENYYNVLQVLWATHMTILRQG